MQHEIYIILWLKVEKNIGRQKNANTEKVSRSSNNSSKNETQCLYKYMQPSIHTEPTTPNLIERRPPTKPKVWFLWLLRVGFESAMADPEIKTQADPWADLEWT